MARKKAELVAWQKCHVMKWTMWPC